MSIPATHEAWAALINRTTASLQIEPTTKYPTPPLSAIPGTIDHTLLSLSATPTQISNLCEEAREHGFASVCVRLEHVARAVEELQGTPVVVACVIGFHEGTYSTDDKVAETRSAVCKGARELDMVMNYSWLQTGRYGDVYADIVAVREAAAGASDRPVVLKVILETSQLTRDQIAAGCVLACLAGADFVKTSTGFNGVGASVENVALMRAVVELVRKGVKVKASGGVRTAADCMKMLRAGAERIGASAGVKIVSELEEQGSGISEEIGTTGRD